MEDPVKPIEEELGYLRDEFAATKQVRDEFAKQSIIYHQLQSKCKDDPSQAKISRPKNDIQNIPKSQHDDQIRDLDREIKDYLSRIHDQETRLPGNNGLYLQLIVGNLNVTLPTSELKRKYKESYEEWKLGVSIAIAIFSVFNLIFSHRLTDALHYFLILWFYCTLTIRESILVANGSRIRGWWVSHHYVSAFLTGIHILWPADAHEYMRFRTKFVVLSLMISLVQIIQYTYQSGLLYRLRSLRKVDFLHITVDGIPSWAVASKDALALYVVTPFLIMIYAYQFYLSVALLMLWLSIEPTDGPSNTWQIIWMSTLYLILALGNFSTLMMTLYSKKKLKELKPKPN
ncbi:Oidioi.mRNA.OKI2018_I69.chr2.g6514.t2.cds [Oikopleura dioica]|uniref:Oidioi.mRNA.OKI2018_I69.chr2.g6514.t2.cds n=1 Tax=Oikopleura dioica TaxID=34765 RepID=A0ABN7T3X3_OIKDI|nr:Oidioi.mRNA.OKI2018_I69.chr2.g6514.t2.cds [Oikopleura dioica]